MILGLGGEDPKPPKAAAPPTPERGRLEIETVE
jgi:hypothetical protein